MSDLRRRLDILERVIKQTKISLLCPKCLKGFSHSDSLYYHFRNEENETHNRLAMRNKDFNLFYPCYQECLGASIPSEKLPLAYKCFDFQYVLEHHSEDSAKIDAGRFT